MNERETRILMTDVSKISAMLEQHISDSAYYRQRVDNHLGNHPSSQRIWGILIGVGWTGTIAISAVALIG